MFCQFPFENLSYVTIDKVKLGQLARLFQLLYTIEIALYITGHLWTYGINYFYFLGGNRLSHILYTIDRKLPFAICIITAIRSTCNIKFCNIIIVTISKIQTSGYNSYNIHECLIYSLVHVIDNN